MHTVRVSSAKPSNMEMMREKKTKPKYRLPSEIEFGFRFVRRKSVPATMACRQTCVLGVSSAPGISACEEY